MGTVGNYLLRIVTSAMVVSILAGIVGKKGSSAVLIRLIGGLFLTVTIIEPLINFDWDYLMRFSDDFTADAQNAAAYGEFLSDSQYRGIIKSQAEAYILDKAQDYRAELEVEVILSQDELPVPSSVCIKGSISPYAKMCLQQILEDDFNIGKENQTWIG